MMADMMSMMSPTAPAAAPKKKAAKRKPAKKKAAPRKAAKKSAKKATKKTAKKAAKKTAKKATKRRRRLPRRPRRRRTKKRSAKKTAKKSAKKATKKSAKKTAEEVREEGDEEEVRQEDREEEGRQETVRAAYTSVAILLRTKTGDFRVARFISGRSFPETSGHGYRTCGSIDLRACAVLARDASARLAAGRTCSRVPRGAPAALVDGAAAGLCAMALAFAAAFCARGALPGIDLPPRALGGHRALRLAACLRHRDHVAGHAQALPDLHRIRAASSSRTLSSSAVTP